MTISMAVDEERSGKRKIIRAHSKKEQDLWNSSLSIKKKN